MKVAILGPGLLGGSIALALHQQGAADVAVWARRAEAVDAVRAAGFARLASTRLAEVVTGAGVVILATPIGALPLLAREICADLSPSALVMDVGSVKAAVVAEIEPIFAGRARFIGSHPMAGSEQTGLQAARADLFAGAVCLITPTARTALATADEATAFWQSLGGIVRQLSPEAHDAAVAWISHLPHLLAATLVNTVAAQEPDALNLCGPGFRDTTRVAAGPPEMWTEILAQNHPAVRKSLDALIEKLREVATLLDRAAPERDSLMKEFLTHAKAERDRLRLTT